MFDDLLRKYEHIGSTQKRKLDCHLGLPKTSTCFLNIQPDDKILETAIYFSAVTFSTVGYGDLAPKSLLARHVTTSQILLTYILTVLIIATLVSKASNKVTTRKSHEISEAKFLHDFLRITFEDGAIFYIPRTNIKWMVDYESDQLKTPKAIITDNAQTIVWKNINREFSIQDYLYNNID